MFALLIFSSTEKPPKKKPHFEPHMKHLPQTRTQVWPQPPLTVSTPLGSWKHPKTPSKQRRHEPTEKEIYCHLEFPGHGFAFWGGLNNEKMEKGSKKNNPSICLPPTDIQQATHALCMGWPVHLTFHALHATSHELVTLLRQPKNQPMWSCCSPVHNIQSLISFSIDGHFYIEIDSLGVVCAR